MLSDMNLDPASVTILPLSYYLSSPSLGQFTRNGYVDGWLRIGVGSSPESQGSSLTLPRLVEQQKHAVSEVMHTFTSDGPVLPEYKSSSSSSPKKGLYTTVYEYTFAFARNEGQKNLRM